MTEPGSVGWAPAPIKTERLVLRESEARDRAAFVELFASPEVGTYLGGPRPRDELERTVPEVPGRRHGFFVIELDGAMIGMITLDRRDAERPGHLRPEGGEIELGYMFLPSAWGCGYAAEACAAALGWFGDAHPGEPVVLCTQIANDRSMRVAAKLGFTEVERFEEYGAAQWFGMWSSVEHATSKAYDAAAPQYAELFRDELRARPFDRAMLSAFAEVVGASGEVADLGCGPGHITSHLRESGLAAFGVDASPTMIRLARQTYPGLRFDVGSMAALTIADGVLGGVLSRWSVIHTPPPELPVVLAEFHRVLAPGGHLLIGFSAAGDASHPTQVFDHAVAPAYRWWPDHLAAMLRESGLAEVARMVREPTPTDRRQFQEVHLLARKA